MTHTNPVLVEVTRGGVVEGLHRGSIALVGTEGNQLLALGDTLTPIFPRSAIKILQALPLIESGAADAFGFGDRELALACASHNGEPEHVAVAAGMLARAGLDANHLGCGVQHPMRAETAYDLARAHQAPGALHNNCSGKHAGMLATAHHLGEGLAGYTQVGHPVQRRVARVLQDLTGVAPEACACGTDGCSIPTWAMPLERTAAAFATLAAPVKLAKARADAVARLTSACLNEPEMTSGTGRACARLIRAAGGQAYVKVGAEGVYCGFLPGQKIGIALKIDDGGKRAAEVVIANLLAALLPQYSDALRPMCRPALRNWNAIHVGDICASPHLTQALAELSAPSPVS